MVKLFLSGGSESLSLAIVSVLVFTVVGIATALGAVGFSARLWPLAVVVSTGLIRFLLLMSYPCHEIHACFYLQKDGF